MFGPHDGTRVRPHPYRRMMLFLMRGRNESAVYFEQRLDLSKTLPWLAEWNVKHGAKATLFHVILHGISSVLHERERLNRFTVGRRTFQRTHRAVVRGEEADVRRGAARHDQASLRARRDVSGSGHQDDERGRWREVRGALSDG